MLWNGEISPEDLFWIVWNCLPKALDPPRPVPPLVSRIDPDLSKSEDYQMRENVKDPGTKGH